jgi:hypothetical protein
MPCGKWTITDVPADQLDGMISDCNLDNPNSVDTEQQADGSYHVIVTYDPCPPGKKQEHTKPFEG